MRCGCCGWIPTGTAAAISVAVTWAEAHHACVVANYRMTTGHNVLMANRDPTVPAHHITDEEFEQMPNFAEVGCGLPASVPTYEGH